MYPGAEAGQVMRDLHCAHARYVRNLAVEQQSWWRPGRCPAPGSAERQRQLARARQAEPWLREGSSAVQQQALRDYDHAVAAFFGPGNPARKPGFRSKRGTQGFVIRDVKACRVSRKWGELFVPKCGRVRFRWSRPLPRKPGMARVTFDRPGRWHVSFPGAQTAVERVPGAAPGVGVDRGVRTALVTSGGQHYRAPRISDRDAGHPEAELLRVPVADILAATGRLAAERAKPGDVTPLVYPVLGGAGLPRPWPDALRDGGLKGKQVLVGSTAHEMTAFLGPVLDDGPGAAREARATEEVFGAGVAEIAAACAAQGISAYAYRFTRASTADPALGAAHCAELPFMFGNLRAYAGAPMLGPVGDADRELAREMTTAFAAFAATGVPAAGGGTPWPAYEPGSGPGSRLGGHIRTFGP
jgi:Carboxylesterase family